MQNRVNRTRVDALSARRGRFVLAVCAVCGFAWNRAFDPSLLVYDESYDNAVPSAVMRLYYEELVSYLGAKYLDRGGLVVDVGCGDGAFLRLLCETFPAAHGLGIDPALPRSENSGTIVLLKDVFRSEQIDGLPALILSRHVLEHMPRPVDFLAEIHVAGSRFGVRPCYFEVPDLTWVIDHGAFWDFCYEHCNYFTAGSFAEAMQRAGFTPVEHRAGFGRQYLWYEGTTSRSPPNDARTRDAQPLTIRLSAYAQEEAERINAVRQTLREERDRGGAIAIWGMATKGIVFCVLVDPDGSLIDRCIDVNRNKQGSFVPVTGHQISAPVTLQELSRPLTVVVMNENYRDEIEATCRELGLTANLITLGS